MTMSNDGISKLVEEIGELGQVCGKVLAYGFGRHPDGGPRLQQRMEDEMADVMAAVHFVIAANGLNRMAVERRGQSKLDLFNEWHQDVTA